MVNHVGHKCLGKHPACVVAWNAAALHVEEGLLVELAGSCSMTCLYFVAVYLKLRRGVHACVGRNKDVAVCLCCICVACVLVYDYPASECSVGFVEDGSLEELAACAVASFMAQDYLVRYYLFA